MAHGVNFSIFKAKYRYSPLNLFEVLLSKLKKKILL